MKKFLCIMLTVVMVIGLMSGCGKKGGSSDTVTILYPGDESERMTAFLGDEFAKKMQEDLGLKVKLIYVPWDQYWEQKDIMLAAKEPIDLYWDGLPDLATFVNKKQAFVLNDLIDKYGQDMLKVLPEKQLKGSSIDGKIYGIPTAYAPSSGMYQLVCVRQDILEAVGMTELKTPEDLKTFAQKAKEKFPDMKGPADPIFKPLTRGFATEQLNWVASGDLAVYGETSNKVYDYYETDAFKKVAQYNRDMYNAGLYSDDLTIKYNERDSRMQTGLYLWVEGSLGKENEIIDSVKVNAPDARLKSYILKPEEPRYVIATGGEVLCIPQTAPNPEGAMKFLNWMYKSQDNYLFALYGVKDKDYKVVDGRIERITKSDFFYEWMFRNENYQLFAPEIDQAYIDEYKSWDDQAIEAKSIGFRFNNENVKEIETAVGEIAKKDLDPILYGFSDYEKEYPKAIQKLKDAGIEKYIAEVQKQMDEFLAKNK